MEAPNINPFPEINLGIVDRAKEVGQRLLGLCSYYPPDASGYPSDYPKQRGAAAMLDRALDEPTDGEAYEPDLNSYAEVADSFLEIATAKEVAPFGWDSCGNYFEGDGAL